MRVIRSICAAATAAALWSGTAAAADWKAALPQFNACNPSSPPNLPARWRAVGLLSQFNVSQLEVGEFVYDSEAAAMRASIYGLEGGALDVLITETETYQIVGPHDAPTGCVAMGRVFRPPSNRWLAEGSVCTGEFPIAGTPAQWWKVPGEKGRANWLWLNKATGLPMRSVFTAPSDQPSVIGGYSMIHFSTFTPLPKTKLAALRNFCIDQSEQAQQRAAQSELLVHNEAGEAERQQRIGALVPGLSRQACARMQQARWPDQFVATVILTPTAMNQDPYSSLMYYDWRHSKSQLAMMFQGSPPKLLGHVLLKNGVGYRIQKRGNAEVCEPVFPGTVRPDWTTSAWCQCRGVIEGNPAISPHAATQIISCPIRGQGKRVMWTWFAEQGKPFLFMEAAAQGGGVMFADYYDWRPGQAVPPEDLALPASCPKPEAVLSSALPTLADPSCSDCHTNRR